MSKNSVILCCVISVSIAAVLIVYVWSSNNRYYLTSESSTRSTGSLTIRDGRTYEIDRKTGKTWLLGYKEKTLQKESAEEKDISPAQTKETPDIIELTDSQKDKISGKGRLNAATGWFYAEIHNGSPFVIKKLIITIAAKEKNKPKTEVRDYIIGTSIEPLTMGFIKTEVVTTGDSELDFWDLSAVYGYSTEQDEALDYIKGLSAPPEPNTSKSSRSKLLEALMAGKDPNTIEPDSYRPPSRSP